MNKVNVSMTLLGAVSILWIWYFMTASQHIKIGGYKQPLLLDCDIESACKGCTTCINKKCIDYRRGSPCTRQHIFDDLVLYHRFYYLREINVQSMLCWDRGTTVRFTLGNETNVSISRERFDQIHKSYIIREERCDDSIWAYAPNL